MPRLPGPRVSDIYSQTKTQLLPSVNQALGRLAAGRESPVLTWPAMGDPAEDGPRRSSGPPRACPGRPSTGPSPAATRAAIGEPGAFPYTRGLHPDGYRAPALDDAAVRRLRHAPPSPTGATATCSSRGRPACPWPSTCPRRSATTPTIPRAAGEVGPRGRGHRQPRGHGDAPRRHPARARLDVHDHQRHRRHPAGALRGGGAPARRRRSRRCPGRCRTTSSRSTSRAGPTSTRPRRRCAWSPTCSPTAPSGVPQWNTHLDLRLPHPRGGGDGAAGAGLHLRATPWSTSGAARAAGLDLDALRRARLVLLRLPLRLHRGGGEVPRRAPALGAAGRGSGWASTPARPAPPLPRADRGRHAHRAAARQQRGAGGAAGPGRGAGRLPEPAHQRARTRPWPCPPRTPRAWPCARSRSSPTRRAWRTPWTRWAAPTRWRRPPTQVEREARRLLDEIEDGGGALRGDRARRRSSARSRSRPTATSGGGGGRRG